MKLIHSLLRGKHRFLASGRRAPITLNGGITLVAVLLSAILITVTGCSSGASKSDTARAAAPQTVPVSVAPVLRQDLPVYLVGLGSVTPLNTVSIKSRIDGQLVQVSYKEGQQVNKGDLLATIDPRPYEAQLSQAQAQLFKDQASLRDAQLNYQRFKSLLDESGAMSQQQVDTQKATADQLEGAVRSDQAAIDTVKLNLVYCHITSPISGRVGLRMVDPGNIVHAADQNPMLVITQLQPISVIFNLPEDQLPTVSQRMKGTTLQVQAFSRDDLTKLATGNLLTIDNQIDQTTGTGKLKAMFNNEDNVLWPNQFVNVHLLLEVRKNSTLVPAAAVLRGPQGTFTYVIKSDSTAEVRPVTVGLTQNNISAITQGLNQGEMVVTDGQDKLQAGTKVQARTVKPGSGTGTGGQGSASGPNDNPAQNSAPAAQPATKGGNPAP